MNWNATLIQGDLEEEVLNLKEQLGRNILVLGRGELVRTLMKHDLVDEFRIMIFPFIRGSGKRLFTDNINTMSLKHVYTKTLHSGAVELTYLPSKEDNVFHQGSD
ncbi:dihydrofolate reductase [Paenibacillus sp. 1182]|uniref:dihydrofolate reductase family protein n=1 Tax=Paenibacillus TaxID=44249 RepID=UPI000FA56D7C|nr:dihydrofolate reductase family protein [Paenibacillus sp. 1182]MBP1311719.1 dihydrofolate reductase [Paenibacillus sp. 1182]